MKQEIKVPAMGESITEAIIGNIIKPTGSYVDSGDELLELETDKVNQVLYAQAAGVVAWDVQTEQTVNIGQVIGSIDTASAKEKPAPVKTPEPVKAPEPVKKPQESTTKARILKEEALAPKPQKVEPVVKGERGETRKRMPKIRKIIAERLVEAQRTSAMLTTFNEIDLSEVMAVRSRHKESFEKEHGVKLGFMSFFVKAVVSALRAIPELNSYIDGDELVHREYYDIGIAVGTDRGLFVPVVRNCDKLTFAEIEQSISAFAKKARDGKIAVDDLQGGCFTITNGGVYGSLLSTPILNPPQCGILGMHKIMNRPIAVDNQVVIRPMMYTALSYDHRIVDGKEAVTFLVHLKNYLEDPTKLLLDT